MGHLVNPISLRLSNYVFWNSSWVSKINYTYFLMDDYVSNNFLVDRLKINNYSLNQKINLKNQNIKKKKREINVARQLKLKVLNKKCFNSKFFLFSHFNIVRCKKNIYILCHFLNWVPSSEILLWHFFNKLFYMKFLKEQSRVHFIDYKNQFYFFIRKFLKIVFLLRLYKYKLRLFNFFALFLKKKLVYLKINLVEDVKFVFSSLKEITGEIIASYIGRCLERSFSFNRIFQPILLYLFLKNRKRALFPGRYESYSMVKGLKVCYGGRFRKKRRVSVQHFLVGSVPLNTMNSRISYGSSLAYTRFGVGGVKVWLAY